MKKGFVETYKRALEHPDLQECFQAEFEFFKATLKPVDAVLDVGCGAARPAKDLAGLIRFICGVDYDPKVFALAEQQDLPNNLILIDADATNADRFIETFGNLKFDVIYSTFNTIGCFDDKELYRVLYGMFCLSKTFTRIINITWKQDEETTEFLKKVYPEIGLPIEEITPEYVINPSGRWNRVTKEKIYNCFCRADPINARNEMTSIEIGKYWVAHELYVRTGIINQLR